MQLEEMLDAGSGENGLSLQYWIREDGLGVLFHRASDPDPKWSGKTALISTVEHLFWQ